jgi:hypothetical protein
VLFLVPLIVHSANIICRGHKQLQFTGALLCNLTAATQGQFAGALLGSLAAAV